MRSRSSGPASSCLMRSMVTCAADISAATRSSPHSADFSCASFSAASSLAADSVLFSFAAYNAGPLPVSRWNEKVRDNGDPLLFIESIPYWETRAYVGIILRNYWMYEKQAGVTSKSAQGLAQGMWPRFPHAGGMELVRVGTTYNN